MLSGFLPGFDMACSAALRYGPLSYACSTADADHEGKG